MVAAGKKPGVKWHQRNGSFMGEENREGAPNPELFEQCSPRQNTFLHCCLLPEAPSGLTAHVLNLCDPLAAAKY